MAGFLRFVLAFMLLPACWGVSRSFVDAIVAAAGDGGAFSAETIALLGGMVAFAFAWLALSHPVRAYVFGHELTHAIWGMCFGARASDLRVGEAGGSVRLTKSNFLITLAPYFFPFYTFVVILAALVTYAFLRPLPYLPFWMFLIGFTWAFHLLFTLQTLGERQPDIRLYGRLFSWVFIYLANLLIVLVWLASTTRLTFAGAALSLWERTLSAYLTTGTSIWHFLAGVIGKCTQT